MAFLKRLGWYLVGLSIGIVFLAFFFKKKSEETGTEFCYLPNCRVLKDIRSKSFAVMGKEKDTFSFSTMEPDMKDLLLNGTVDFDRSDTKSKPCKTYVVTHKNMELHIENCPDKAIIGEGYVLKN